VPDRRFERLQTILLDRGVPARYAARLIAELHDHHDDLASARRAAGDSQRRAALTARRSLGSDYSIVASVLARAELRGRWPGVRAALRHACISAGSMSFYGHERAAIARWTVSIGLGALITFATLLALAHTLTISV
jgi:hypothetical protein